MPELPEVENARQVVEKALDRVIAGVDDSDEYVCRPHHPGEIDQALKGGRLVAAHRRGKTMWCDTVTADGEEGPHLGIHLGMGGRIFVTGPSGQASSLYAGGDPHVGGMPEKAGERPGKPEWDRVRITFDDGGELRLFDKRRLGRVHLEPDVDALGPDAAEISRDDFRARVGKGTAPIKARLLDQSVLAGVGNLLADQTLWQTRLSPSRPAGDLSTEELDALRRELRKATRSAIEKGGVHTGEVIAHRAKDETCPRCGAPMERGTIGGRTTWWCSAEQA
ncbi:Fpg/Nei family DNA glycosylase [Actinomycetospora straminea]|uniref:Formamidopyrimidine-DNA glycosylase n=1 Tax=Actinomycetospora straminea TaxID=663607 RepID=A0ABP9EKY1_9PSEU|nr:DNA-formamidopyrimidine glycosylase family protein [Actinomycetospora straminea]MDD7935069.1 formamidopyrimidine-DNA glycosylase [Actinomycetospora straminea]